MRIFAFALALATVGGAYAQSDSRVAEDNQRVLAKFRKLDFLSYFVPLQISKEQFKAILPVIEQGREDWKALYRKEREIWLKVDAQLDGAIEDAVNKSKLPGEKLQKEFGAAVVSVNISERALSDANTDKVYSVVFKNFDRAQKKSAGNLFRPQSFGFTKKSEEMTEEERLKHFVRYILLDPEAYDALRALNKVAQSGS